MTTIKEAKEIMAKILTDLDTQGIHVTRIDIDWRTTVSDMNTPKPQASVGPVVNFEASL